MVVDEGNAIDAVVFVATQYEVDALRREFPAESGLCPGALHGGGNDAAGTLFELLVPDRRGGLLHLFSMAAMPVVLPRTEDLIGVPVFSPSLSNAEYMMPW